MSSILTDSVKTFREKLSHLSRQELLEIIKEQDVEYIKQINRIEYVFAHKLKHLTWKDGSPVEGRNFSNEELALLIDPPFIFDREMAKLGFNEEQQRHIHIASDPVLWAKYFLKDTPRAYQTLVLRTPNVRKVMRFGRRLGKALALDTPIPTPFGWTTMGELKEGSVVFDENGLPCNVTFATEIMYDHDCYEVQFNDGSKITADKEHLWSVETKKIRKNNARNKHKKLPLLTLTTEEMLRNLKVGSKSESNYSIPLAGPLEYTAKDIPLSIDPYVLGFWLGDGSKRGGRVCIGKRDATESIANITNRGYQVTPQISDEIMFNIVGLNKQLRLIGLHDKEEKYIPREYLEASIDQRMELLKGLMDTDGSCSAEDGQLEFCSSYKILADQVFELITSLGFKAHMYECESWLDGIQYRNRFRIYFKTSRPVFKLSRKLNNQIREELPCQIRRYITDIIKVDSVPVRCITVDSPNHLYLAGETCIPTHNTTTFAFFCLWFAYTNNEGKILVMAPMKSHVGLIYDEILRLARQNDLILPKGDDKHGAIVRSVTSPQYEIGFENGASIKFFTTGMKSNNKADVARGQEADIIILDEMDYMGKEDLDALLAMLQTTSARKMAEKQLMGASTPTGQRNTFYNWNENPDFSFTSFWFPSYCNPFWTKKIEQEMRVYYPNEQVYKHEIEADYGEDIEGVYPQQYIKYAFQEPGWDYKADVFSARSDFVFGVDWDKYGAGVNLVVLEICADSYELDQFAGKTRVAYREEINKGEFTYTGAVDRIIELNSVFRPKHIYVDRGAGEVQVELLHKYGLEHPESKLHKTVKGWQFSESIDIRDPYTQEMVKKDLKPFMVDNLYKMLENQKIVFPAHDEELFLQLISYIVLRVSSTGKPVFAAGGNTVDHAHDALILACFAIADNYDELLNPTFASRSIAIKSDPFLPTFAITTKEDERIAEETWGGVTKGPVSIRRSMAYNISSRGSSRRPIKRKMF